MLIIFRRLCYFKTFVFTKNNVHVYVSSSSECKTSWILFLILCNQNNTNANRRLVKNQTHKQYWFSLLFAYSAALSLQVNTKSERLCLDQLPLKSIHYNHKGVCVFLTVICLSAKKLLNRFPRTLLEGRGIAWSRTNYILERFRTNVPLQAFPPAHFLKHGEIGRWQSGSFHTGKRVDISTNSSH